MKKIYYIVILILFMQLFNCSGNLFNNGIDSPERTGKTSNTNPPGNSIPEADDKSIIVSQNSSINFQLTASDADNDTLTWHIETNPGHGSLSGTAPNLEYTPAADYSGSDGFTFYVNDGYVNSGSAAVGITVSGNVTWSEADMGLASAVTMGKIASGKTHGDGITRVYAGIADTGDGDIIEFTYSPGIWNKVSVVNEMYNLYRISGLAILDIGNGVNIYAAGHGFGEYLFSGSAWSGGEKDIPVDNGVQWCNGLKFGQGQNDGKIRGYIADWDRIVEVTYSYGNWEGEVIDTNEQWTNDLVILDGRNDGTFRLYAILNTYPSKIWEYTHNGTAWDIAECSDQLTAATFEIITGGNGRNDGVERLYAWGNSGLFEFTYNTGSGWSYEILTATKYNASDTGEILLGDGRNDGILRLYTADGNGIGEYTYTDKWDKTGLLSSRASGGVCIGDGRNDSTNRVYASSGSHIYEYTAVPE